MYSSCVSVPVLAVYGGKVAFGTTLQSPFTLAEAKDQLEEGLNLDAGTYTLEYQFEGGKVMLNTDENLKSALDINCDNLPFTLFLQPSSGTCSSPL